MAARQACAVQSFSVIVPAFNEGESLVELCDRVNATFAKLEGVSSLEILIIDDGSTDDTPEILSRLTRKRPYVRHLTFRRNYGKSLALMAGFQNVDADVVITMDADLQDSPEEIPAFIEKLDEGFDLVTGWRHQRKDQTIRRLGSWLFNVTVSKTTGLKLHDLNCGFKAFRRKTVESLCLFGDYHRYIPVQVHLSGFRVAEVPVTNNPRLYGRSKYRTFRYQGFFDLLSLLFIHRYGLNPLHFFGTVSALFIVPNFLMLCWFTYQQYLYLAGHGDHFRVLNRPLLAINLTALMIGVIILLTGFVCDFFLHHKIRDRISSITAAIIKDQSQGPEHQNDVRPNIGHPPSKP